MRKITFVLLLTSISFILLTPNPTRAEYNPSTGRFLQRDPIGVQSNLNLFDFIFRGPATLFNDYMISQYKDGMNIYQYVLSDPIGNMDPSGFKSGPCGECAVPSNGCRNFYAEFLGFGEASGAIGTPSIINDVRFIRASSSFLSGIQSLMGIAATTACGAPGTKMVDGLLEGIDAVSGEPGSFGELAIKNAMDLKYLIAKTGGYYLWMKIKFKKCVSCTVWTGTWYAPWSWLRTCKSGKWAYEIVWHPCRLSDPASRGKMEYSDKVQSEKDFKLALKDCYKSIAFFPLKPYQDHSLNAERKEYKVEE